VLTYRKIRGRAPLPGPSQNRDAGEVTTVSALDHPVGSLMVARARLVRLLQEAHDLPLALLVAPAGYGKSTLLTQWALVDPRPFDWIRAGSLRGGAASLVRAVEGARRPRVFVVDDAHELRDPEVLPVLGALADSMPSGSQLVLSTREEPGLAVGRLRAHRMVVEVRADELAMNVEEADELLASAGLELTEADVHALVARTEGWPVALYLAALALRPQPDVHEAVNRFAGDDRVVADYLRDELLAPLSGSDAEFLVRTAVLETLSGPACDAVLGTGGSGTTLARLARSNVLLVSLDRSGAAYRHHRLFADMLRSELRRTDPSAELDLHRRASSWYAARGEIRSAIHHAVAAGAVDDAADVLWPEAADRIAHGHNDQVRRWLAEFRPEEVGASARLALASAASALAAGNRPQLGRRTAEAAGSLDRLGRRAPRPLRAALTLLEACAEVDGISAMGAQAARARALEPERGAWRATADWLEGVAHHLSGRRREARMRLERGGRGGSAAAPYIQALCLAQLALLVLEDGDSDQAAVLAGRARAQIRADGLADYPTSSLVFAVSALVRASRGIVDEAAADLVWSSRLLLRLVEFMPWYEVETRLVLAGAALELGDLSRLRRLVADATDRLRSVPDAPELARWAAERRRQVDALAANEASVLTQAELRVLHLLPTHLSVPAIASRLYVSPNTVKTHVRALYRKLEASSRAEAVTQAAAAGLLDDVQAA
jgi:LuxR family transcriptional regulator, maltose regulon positive regulatory protein